MNLILKATSQADLVTLFAYQTHKTSILMAAFTAENPNDKEAYMDKWSKIITNPQINMQSIYVDDQLVGSILCFDMMDETNVSYWLGHKYWNKGIASKSLKRFLQKTKKRLLIGRTAFDNYGSQKVLTKCGFTFMRKETDFANARGKKIEEYIYILK